jgi:hypothetical protein
MPLVDPVTTALRFLRLIGRSPVRSGASEIVVYHPPVGQVQVNDLVAGAEMRFTGRSATRQLGVGDQVQAGVALLSAIYVQGLQIKADQLGDLGRAVHLRQRLQIDVAPPPCSTLARLATLKALLLAGVVTYAMGALSACPIAQSGVKEGFA